MTQADMKWVSTVSENPDHAAAAAEAAAAILAGIPRGAADLMMIFISPHHKDFYDDIPVLIQKQVGARVFVGCSGGGVIGGGREVEDRPGVSVTAAVLPGVQVVAFHIDNSDLPEPDGALRDWQDLVGVKPSKKPDFLLLPDPFSFDAERFLNGLDRVYPDSCKVGGLASGAPQPGGNTLHMMGNHYSSGLVGVALSGDITVDTIVAQGCRPIGDPMFITKCDRNLLLELDGDPVGEKLKNLYDTLEGRDQELFRNSLFLGVVMREEQQEYRQGDFLIRNLVGMDPQSGGIAIGSMLGNNQVVQFHLRDAMTSAEDLDHLLNRYQEDRSGAAPEGSLMFSCLGRGMHLYGRPDHDTTSFRRRLGDVPLGGFFCNGEIGPVQGRTYLHGYTSSFALFRRPQ
jgi:small ligand-binding sensory domain FIST